MASSSEDDCVILLCTSSGPVDADFSGEETEESFISTADILSWDLPSLLRSSTIKIKANRTRLIEESTYFCGLLGGSFSESSLNSISIQWNLEAVLNVIRCIYGCRVNITSENFLILFEGALYFGVDSLLSHCKSWFLRVSSSSYPLQIQIRLYDLILIWSFSRRHGIDFFQELCEGYLARNFMSAMSSKCFKYVSCDLLLICVKHPDLTVESEMHLADGLLTWLEVNKEKLESSSKAGCGSVDILKQIRSSLLPLWFAAGKRRSYFFSALASQSIESIFSLIELESRGSRNISKDDELDQLRIRLTKYSKRVDLSGCPQITSTILLHSILTFVDPSLKETCKEFLSNHEHDQFQPSLRLLQTSPFVAVQEVDISRCPRLHLSTAIECFSKSFPSLRSLKAAHLLNFKAITLCRVVQKCPLVYEVDFSLDVDPLVSSEGSAVSSNLPRPDCSSTQDGLMATIYSKIKPSKSNIRKLTLEGRSELSDLDLLNISDFCASLCYLNVKGCISITDNGIASLIDKCKNLHSLVVCLTSFGMHSIQALCSGRPDFSNPKNSRFGEKHSVSLAPHLQMLHMGGCKGVDQASLVEIMSQKPFLKSLCLGDTYLADDALYSFSGSSLEMLDVSNTMISGAALAHVIHRNPNLKCLNVRGCQNLLPWDAAMREGNSSLSHPCEGLFNELGKTCKLEDIALGWGLNYFSLEAMKPAILSLRAISIGLGGSLPEDALRLLPTTCPLLESLVLHFQVISDSIMKNIIASLRGLQVLALCYCLGDISISSFKFSMPNLRKLKLERVTPWMDSDDLVCLTQNCANLTELSLRGCPLINSDSQQIISSGWPGLVSLHLEDCGEVTANGVSSLFSCVALEDLLLRHTGSGIQRNFILEAASRLPMLRQLSLDSCDANEGGYDIPDDLQGGNRYFLRSIKVARCKLQTDSFGFRRKPMHKETLVAVFNSKTLVRKLVKERL